ncbi:MAG: protein-L-isoaspartate O-methyltransferase [Rhodospirillales bacterium]|nr:protein-L-isoaspartate O-methyltransferase [Alphaproteobacteria bacterium]USO03196.1 MAG: protein-L-isoaspartate O-methyltransferase [Rhodospirillales bacterium]
MNFTQCRENMVEGQIQTNGVTEPSILGAYRAIPRERFVMPGQESISYCDESLPIGAGRCLMEPMVHARLLQAAAPKSDDVVLDIGGATGYSAAVFSSLVSTVVSVEKDPDFLARAEALWQELGLCNVVGLQGELKAGDPRHAPYDLIFFNGAVASVSDDILAQVDIGGRLVAVVMPSGASVGKAVKMTRTGEDDFSSEFLFDVYTPYLPGMGARTEFVF